MLAVPLVLVLLAGAAQVLLRLNARDAVAALAHDAARDAGLAGSPTAASTARAGQTLRDRLGRAGDDAEIRWSIGPQRVEVRVRLPSPRLLAIGSLAPLSRPIDVRRSAPVEAWR
jgi:hypothetical protein